MSVELITSRDVMAELTRHRLATFASGYGKAHRAFQIGSAVLVVLICLSTVFIKQHSVLDVLGGAAVALAMHVLAGFILKKRRTSHDHPTL